MRAESGEFVRSTEPFRRELLAHCYRMLGATDEAEDAVQETYLRAWRSYGTFEGRSSMRTWLYRIATNACLAALGQRGRLALPSGLGGPADDPDAPLGPAGPDVAWLQPIPDSLVTPDSADPATIVAAREACDPGDALASPLHADLSGLGPIYIQAGGDEALLDDARRMDEHARKAGVDVRLDIFPGMLHTFQITAGRAPEADDAIRKMAEWVRPRLGL